MRSYIVFTLEATLDREQLKAYWQEVGYSLAGYQVKVLANNGPQEVLEGPPPESVLIIEFPDWEAAKAWYDGSEYQRVREHQVKGGLFRGILLQGV
jgi:uncharacterized protein (DUF1330 family)